MKTSDFGWHLPKELITRSLEDEVLPDFFIFQWKTDLLNIDIYDILDYLKEGDCLVINDTRVIPARLYGHKKNRSTYWILLLKRKENDIWECLVKPSKESTPGSKGFTFDGI